MTSAVLAATSDASACGVLLPAERRGRLEALLAPHTDPLPEPRTNGKRNRRPSSTSISHGGQWTSMDLPVNGYNRLHDNIARSARSVVTLHVEAPRDRLVTALCVRSRTFGQQAITDR